MLNLMGVLNTTAANVSCTCNCKRYTSLQSMEISEYESAFMTFCVANSLYLHRDCEANVAHPVFRINKSPELVFVSSAGCLHLLTSAERRKCASCCSLRSVSG